MIGSHIDSDNVCRRIFPFPIERANDSMSFCFWTNSDLRIPANSLTQPHLSGLE